MFDLFLSLIDDGTLDGLRPGFAVNDDWWSVLYSTTEKRPADACEAIARWVDRITALWDRSTGAQGLREQLDGSDHTGGAVGMVLKAAAGAPREYVALFVPRLSARIRELAEPCVDRLDVDPFWSFRSFGDAPLSVSDALFVGLARALESLAIHDPYLLDTALESIRDDSCDALAYLALRAWTNAPARYSDRIASFIAGDPRRLKIGYSTWGSGRSPANYASARAIAAASPLCAADSFLALERAILGFKDIWEARRPQSRGYQQLQLLESLDQSRMSTAGRAKLGELRAKFASAEQEPPKPSVFQFVGSPLPEGADKKMSDEQWLGALKRYAGVDRCLDRDYGRSGGEWQVARHLQEQTKAEPERFAALALRMPDDFPATYFDAVVRGVTECRPADKATRPPIAVGDVVKLVRRVHALPGRPCGQSIARLIELWAGTDWPEDILDTVVWYSTGDTDPNEEVWKTPSASGQPHFGGDPYHAGINSTRGAIAGAVARLLFDDPRRFQRLANAVDSLATDRSVAVRSCAVPILLATLNVNVAVATKLFNRCVEGEPALLNTPHVEDFLRYAGRRNYRAVRPTLAAMLAASEPKVVEAAARQICLLALAVDEAQPDAERVRAGSTHMRKAAADVYSTNIGDGTVGADCRRMIMPFFKDVDDVVRAEAASAFRYIQNLSTGDQAELLTVFLDARPNRASLEHVVAAVEDSAVQLPDLVCRLVEESISAYRAEAGDISKAGSMVAMDLSKIVVRLYTQTDDAAIRGRCLDLIDVMEQFNFLGLSDELRRLDR